MERLWAPWRLQYITGDKEEGCIFCMFPKQHEDRKHLILYRGEQAFVMMNAYPYSNGHLLIVPYRHLADVIDLSDDESLEVMRLTQESCRALREMSSPDGFNIGLNIGAAAGAGIADHVHVHVVPRWTSDTNYMPVLAEVKIIPEALETTYSKLKPLFEKIDQQP